MHEITVSFRHIFAIHTRKYTIFNKINNTEARRLRKLIGACNLITFDIMNDQPGDQSQHEHRSCHCSWETAN